MISAKQCRIYSAECELRASSSDISTPQSLEQSIMALNWSALADEIDRDARAAFSPPGGPMVPSNLARLTHPRHQAGEVAA
jgi:hypothetical protein